MESLITEQIRRFRTGVFLAFLALFLGLGLGAAFGAKEDLIKEKLRGSAFAVLDARYGSDPARAEKALEESWVYLQRSHLHAAGMGFGALVLIAILAIVGATPRLGWTASFLLGFGSLVYGFYWLVAGFCAPGLGGMGPAEEAFEWVALAGTGSTLVGFLAAAVITWKGLASRGRHASGFGF